MMFIVRVPDGWRAQWPSDVPVRVALVRRMPSIVSDGDGLTDLFCIGDEDATRQLQDQGWRVVALSDGWYADDTGGGVAIWGQGAYWEIRDTPFTVVEAVGPASTSDTDGGEGGEVLDVRRGIFGT
jgi:hypothetical protein